MQLDPRTALITGAGRGLGRELALALSAAGVAIAAIDRECDGLISLEEEVRRAGRSISWELADVTDAANLSAKTALLEETLGPIDLLIANAGIGKDTPALDFRAQDIAHLVDVNLLGVANSIAAVLPGMIERRRGHIVGISSLAALYGLPRMMGYCASKAGVNALLESLRMEVRPYDISVTTVCPGFMKTPMNAAMNSKAALLEVDIAVGHILAAIRGRRRLCAFPRGQAWGLWFVRFLPGWVGDYLVRRSVPHLDAPQKASIAPGLAVDELPV